MGGVLLLGLFIGMRHALEADHVAAVASLVTRSRTKGDAMRMGLAWGMGHTVSLCAVGVIILSLDTVLPARFALVLEFAVGFMLVWLGADVLRRLIRERIHFHQHRHADGTAHFHAHSHAGEGDHRASTHEHKHIRHIQTRSFAVGLMHGMAGSAALILVAVDRLDSLWTGLMYMALFGIGSMAGMAALTLVIVVPLRKAADRAATAYRALNAMVGIGTLGFGGWVIYHVGFVEGLIVG